MSSIHLTYPGLAKNAASSSDPDAPILLGDSPAIRQLRSQIQRVAPYLRIALIRGEAGTGKQFVARAIHTCSSGAEGPFIVCDAAALAESIAGGGRSAPPGIPTAGQLLKSAHGGTLYLDAIGRLSPTLQTTLLGFIRSCTERRDPSAQPDRASLRRTGTRILVASDRDLRTLAAVGHFRPDLYALLSGVELVVPPLRQRIEDIPVLAAWLLRRLAGRVGHSPKMLADATLAQLQDRAWPGNLRELDRVLVHASALTDGGLIEPRHLLPLVEPDRSDSANSAAVRPERLDDVIQQHVLEVLTRCDGNKLRAAELLGISRSTLYRMLESRTPADALQV